VRLGSITGLIGAMRTSASFVGGRVRLGSINTP